MVSSAPPFLAAPGASGWILLMKICIAWISDFGKILFGFRRIGCWSAVRGCASDARSSCPRTMIRGSSRPSTPPSSQWRVRHSLVGGKTPTRTPLCVRAAFLSSFRHIQRVYGQDRPGHDGLRPPAALCSHSPAGRKKASGSNRTLGTRQAMSPKGGLLPSGGGAVDDRYAQKAVVAEGAADWSNRSKPTIRPELETWPFFTHLDTGNQSLGGDHLW